MKAHKYPRTFHLPNSLGATKDDKTLNDTSFFKNKKVVVTIKMDGENTTMYSDKIHSRSIDSNNHLSRDWVKNFHSKIKHEIPENIRICGENLYAKHSIFYKHLSSYFLVFNIWENDFCLNWDDTVIFSKMLKLDLVPVIFEGIFDLDSIEKAFQEYRKKSNDEVEGYVVRIHDSFCFQDFDKCVAKWVRKNHVTTDEHWMFSEIKQNELERKENVQEF